MPTQLQVTATTTTSSFATHMVVSRVALPDPENSIRRVLNGQVAAPLPILTTATGGPPVSVLLSNKSSGQVENHRVLDDARKRLLAKNNVSIFQKSKGGPGSEESGREPTSEGQRPANGPLVAQDWKDCLKNQGLSLTSTAPRMSLKIPRPPPPRPINPVLSRGPSPLGPRAMFNAVASLRYQPAGCTTGKVSGLRQDVRGPISVEHGGGGISCSSDATDRWSERSAPPSGHPGLPSGLMHMASSVIPASKSPTKITPRTEARHVMASGRSESAEVRRARLDLLLFQSPQPLAASPTTESPPRGCFEHPPVLSPQVSSLYPVCGYCHGYRYLATSVSLLEPPIFSVLWIRNDLFRIRIQL